MHTKVVEASRGQPLGEMGRKQETGEEGEEEVVGQIGLAGAAVSPAAQEQLRSEKKTQEVQSKN